MASVEDWCHEHNKPKFACESFAHGSGGQVSQADLPELNIGPVDQAAIEFFNVYETNVRAGFTPPQSLYLLAVQITGNPGIAPGIDLPEPPQSHS